MTQEEGGGNGFIRTRRQEQWENYAFLDVKKKHQNLGSRDVTSRENTLYRKLLLLVSPAEAEWF